MPAPRRRETLVLAILTLVGVLARVWHPGLLRLEHFDEGIYALAGLWSLGPRGLAGLDPLVVPYAPPGLPLLIGASYLVMGASAFGAILPSLIAGAATIPVVDWVGRRTFGPGTGAAAAGLAALSGVHILFSRMALTDVPFLLAWLVALGLGGRFLERPTVARALALGLAVGVAQNFKYNGWLAGAIVAATAILGTIVRRTSPQPRAWLREGILLALAAAVAGLVYLPWYAFVEAHGGYAGLVAHHRGYLMGLAAWPENLWLQHAQAGRMSGAPGWTVAGWLAGAGGLAAVAPPGSLAGRLVGTRAIAIALVGSVVAALAPTFPWWVGLVGCPLWLRDRRPAVRLLAVGFLAMTALTPLYHPYARLWLPTQALGWILLAGTAAEALHESGPRSRWALRALVAGFALALAVQAVAGRMPPPAWEGGSPYLSAERRGGAEDPRSQLATLRAPLAVYARPSVLFELLGSRAGPTSRVASLEAALEAVRGGSWALIDGALEPSAGDLGSRVPTANVSSWDEPIGLVTALDLDPGSALGTRPAPGSVRMTLVGPRPAALGSGP